ncbi:MAG: glycosyltransferase family 4 protein [Bacteroidia bacterium]|nr:glycosyltransferase family 4 protein [Bacteroidia bacterium]
MRILQLCKKFPYPLKDGESVAVHAMSRGYVKNGCKVGLLALNTSKHFVQFHELPEAMSHFSFVESIFIDTSVNPIHAFFNLFTDKSYNIERFDLDRFHQKLKVVIDEFKPDIVQIESLYMVPYIASIRKYCNAFISMRSHNLEFEIWQDLAKGSKNPLKKWYFNLCAKRLKKYETENFGMYDTLIPISESDYNKYQQLKYKGPFCVSPVGLDTSRYSSEYTTSKSSLRLGYIGSLDWIPNIEGVSWFFENAWSLIKEKYPHVEFHLAGRNASENFKNTLPSNVNFHGEVGNAVDFIAGLDAVIVPLFSGSGIRVKILESMAMGKIVLSTYKGFEGIGVEDGKNGFVFESSNDIIHAIETCINDVPRRKTIQKEALMLVREKFDFSVLAKRTIDHYNQLLNQRE